MSRQRTASEIALWQRCPSLWAWRYWAQRVPYRPPSAASALARGNYLHDLHDSLIRGQKIDDFRGHLDERYLDRALSQGEEPSDSFLDQLDVLAVRFAQYWWEEGGAQRNYIASEVTLSSPTTKGKLDAIEVDPDGSTWITEVKTLGASRWMPSKIAMMKRSLQGIIYKELMLANGYDDYRGMRLVMIPLDPLHSRQAGSSCPHCDKKGLAWRHIDLRPIDLIIRDRVSHLRSKDLARVFAQIEIAELVLSNQGWPECGGPPALEQRGDSTGGCEAPWGNRTLCPYIGGCNDEEGFDIFSADDWRYEDPETRYHESEED